MSDDDADTAPELGDQTDVAVGDDTAVFLMRGEKPPRRGADTDRAETVDTPDNLGGTGGVQPGGAG